MNDRVRIDAHNAAEPNLVLVESRTHVHDLTHTVNLDVIIELIPELCEGLLKINLA